MRLKARQRRYDGLILSKPLALSLTIFAFANVCVKADETMTSTSTSTDKTDGASPTDGTSATGTDGTAASETAKPVEPPKPVPAQPPTPQDEEKARKFKAQMHAFKGGQMAREKNFRQAESEFKEAAKYEPENMTYLEGYASAAHHANDWKEAVEAYNKILKTDAKHTEVHKTLAECLVKLGLTRYDEAIEEYKKAVPVEKDKADVWRRIANLRTAQSRRPEAMEAYRNAIKAAPEDGVAYRLLAAIQWQGGSKSDAMSTYKEGVHSASKDADLWAAYAYALVSNQQWREAADAYKSASKIKGPSPELEAGYKSAMERAMYEDELAKRKAELDAKKHHRH